MKPEAQPRTRDTGSDAAKGLLLALVALGHSQSAQLACPWLREGGLYDFHVIGFLLLPFLRPPAAFTRAVLVDRAIRYLVPYLVFALFSAVCWHLIFHPQVPWTTLPYGLLRGDVYGLSGSIGFTYLWFMPCLLSLTVLRSLVATATQPLRWLLVLGVVSIHGAIVACFVPLPFNPYPALWVLPLGWATAWLARFVHFRAVWILLACACGVLAARLHHHINVGAMALPTWQQPGLLILHDVYAVVATLAVVGLGPLLARVPGLVALGRYSLAIYLGHQFVLKAAEVWASHQVWYASSQAKVGVAVIAVPASLALGWMLVRVLEHPRIRSWILPNNVGDWPLTARWRPRA